ncbi:unnamed protein product [Coffea canephora]|uniref:Uncharacterized protein n=1 Tax=Coffea canephora TaxID=49390 RepID=A0A068UME1_COFCA|nr:unnamed protein product [Coffea canephora]
MHASFCDDHQNRSDDAEQEQAEAFVDHLVQDKGVRQRPQQKQVKKCYFFGTHQVNKRDFALWDESNEENDIHKQHVV